MQKAKTENQHLHIQTGDNMDRDLPDRIMNPDMYEIDRRTGALNRFVQFAQRMTSLSVM